MRAIRWRAHMAVMAGARFGPSFPPRMRGGKLKRTEGAPMSTAPEPTIEVMVGNGGQVRMPASVSPDLASAIVRALVGR